MTQRRGLGRGLGALIPDSSGRPDAGELSSEDSLDEVVGVRYAEIPLAQIRPNPRQPRVVFDEEALAELARRRIPPTASVYRTNFGCESCLHAKLRDGQPSACPSEESASFAVEAELPLQREDAPSGGLLREFRQAGSEAYWQNRRPMLRGCGFPEWQSFELEGPACQPAPFRQSRLHRIRPHEEHWLDSGKGFRREAVSRCQNDFTGSQMRRVLQCSRKMVPCELRIGGQDFFHRFARGEFFQNEVDGDSCALQARFAHHYIRPNFDVPRQVHGPNLP